jgi:LytS/YehU family sensor histidine kinase
VQRHPFARGHRSGALAAHLAAAVALLLAHSLAYDWASRAFTPAAAQAAWSARLLRSSIGWLPVVAIAYAAAVAVAYSLEYARRERSHALAQAALSEALVRAELSALRMQLHPHFLFNSLNTVAGLVRDRQPDQAVDLIAQLGAVLRHVLTGADAQVVPLEHEIAFTRQYLAIEQARFCDRLEVRWDVDDSLLDAGVPGLLLQPLVENALRHGISRRPDGGIVSIRALRRGRAMVLQIGNDGPVITNGAMAAGSGVGLANARARLERLYGAEGSLVLADRDGGGAIVEVTVPIEPGNGS